jgi:hypothetical protein
MIHVDPTAAEVIAALTAERDALKRRLDCALAALPLDPPPPEEPSVWDRSWESR